MIRIKLKIACLIKDLVCYVECSGGLCQRKGGSLPIRQVFLAIVISRRFSKIVFLEEMLLKWT